MKHFVSISLFAAFAVPTVQPFLFNDQAALIERIVSARPSFVSRIPKSAHIIGGVVPHHAPLTFPLISSFYFQLQRMRRDNPTFVVLGPDHYNKAQYDVITTKNSFATPFGALDSNTMLIEKLLTKKLAIIDNEPFRKEHAIQSQTAFIKKFFPNAKIVGLMFRASAGFIHAKKIGELLAKQKNNVILIASIDFSHYYSASQARKIDTQSLQALRVIDTGRIPFIEADSPAAITALIRFLEARKGVRLLDSYLYNTADFSSNSKNTTGYIIGIFGSP